MFWQNKKIENIDIVFPYMSLSKQKKMYQMWYIWEYRVNLQ